MIVVQHMPPGFTAPLAKRLDGLSRDEGLRGPARTGRRAGNGLYRACRPSHDVVKKLGSEKLGNERFTTERLSPVLICLSDAPFNTVHKPSVDVTMLSVAEVFGNQTLGIILTGMGTDGLQGMTAIHEAGGLTMGQDEASSVVYGMPRCCAERGILEQVVPLSEVPRHILQAIHYLHKV